MRSSLVFAVLGALLGLLLPAPAADAYAFEGVKWCGASPSTPKAVSVWNGMTGDYYQPGETAWRAWAAGMSAVRYVPATSKTASNVDMSSGYHFTDWSGLSTWSSSGGCFTHVHVAFNTQFAYYGYDHITGVISHEMGHAQGLGHSIYDSLMYGGNNWNKRPYIAPVRDDINGISALYGGTLRNKWSDTTVAGGAVSRDANGNPTWLGVTTAGTNRYARASTPYDVFPASTRAIVIQVSLTPNPLYRTSICACWLKDPTRQDARMYDLEVNNDRFVVTYTKPDGTLGSVPLTLDGSTPVPTQGVVYYSTLIIYNKYGDGVPYFRAYVQRASDSVEVAHASGSGTQYRINGLDSYALGPAAWTDVSTNPLSATNLGSGWSGRL